MNKIKCLILLVGVAAFGCAPQEESKPTIEKGNAIVGLASPIRLDFGQTEIHLGDYFENPEQVDSVSFGVEVKFSIDKSKGILTVESYGSDDPITFLSVSYDGVDYEIPVFKSRKQAHVFKYEPPTGDPQEIGLKGNINGWNYKAGMLSNKSGTWYDTRHLYISDAA